MRDMLFIFVLKNQDAYITITINWMSHFNSVHSICNFILYTFLLVIAEHQIERNEFNNCPDYTHINMDGTVKG